MENKYKKYLIGFGILSILLILLALFILVINRPEDTSKNYDAKLYLSDIAATNIQEVQSLNQGVKDNEISYFTGSGGATISFDENTFLKTTSTTTNAVLIEPNNVSGSSDRVLVKTSVNDINSLILDRQVAQPISDKESGIWLEIIRGNINKAPFDNQASVADAYLDGSTIYALEIAGNKLNLTSYTNSTKSVLKSGIKDTSIVGAQKNTVVLLDQKGNLSVYKEGQYSSIDKKVGNAFFDYSSESVVFSNINDEEVSEEGGTITANPNESNNREVKIYDINTKNIKNTDTLSSYFLVNSGFIMSFNSFLEPTLMKIQEIKGNINTTINIDRANSKVSSQFKSVLPLNIELTKFAATTANDELVLIYENPQLFSAIPAFRLPNIPIRQDSYIFNYSVANNQVLITAEVTDSANFIKNTLAILKNTCDCDVNQVHKTWSIIEED